MNRLDSDELRRQLSENNAAMNTLAEDNKKIVELLAGRGLQAVEPDSHPSKASQVTYKQLRQGGWWCDEAGKEMEQELARRNVIIISKKWRQKKYILGCMSRHPRIAVQFVGPEFAAGLKQIHRIGSEFYWSAP